MSDDEVPLITIFCDDSGHLRQGETVPRHVIIATFERLSKDYPQELWPYWEWHEVGLYSAKMAKYVAQMPEPLPRPRMRSTPEGRAAWTAYKASLRPAHDKLDSLHAGSYSQKFGPRIAASADRPAWRFRFPCALCRRTVVAKDANLFRLFGELHEAGVASISLSALASRL